MYYFSVNLFKPQPLDYIQNQPGILDMADILVRSHLDLTELAEAAAPSPPTAPVCKAHSIASISPCPTSLGSFLLVGTAQRTRRAAEPAAAHYGRPSVTESPSPRRAPCNLPRALSCRERSHKLLGISQQRTTDGPRSPSRPPREGLLGKAESLHSLLSIEASALMMLQQHQ